MTPKTDKLNWVSIENAWPLINQVVLLCGPNLTDYTNFKTPYAIAALIPDKMLVAKHIFEGVNGKIPISAVSYWAVLV